MYRRIRVTENPYSRIFYAVTACITSLTTFFQEHFQTSSQLKVIKVWVFFEKNIEKKKQFRCPDKNYYYFCKSNIPVVCLIVGSANYENFKQHDILRKCYAYDILVLLTKNTRVCVAPSVYDTLKYFTEKATGKTFSKIITFSKVP